MAGLESLDSAVEAVRHRNKNAQRTEGNSITVTARVVSPPIPFNTADADLLYGDPTANRERQASLQRRGLASAPSRMSAFVFRGYIVDKDWAQNPHLLITNPCSMAQATGAQLADIEDAIKLCTKFVSEEGYSGEVPKVGDWVKVRLNKIRQPGNNEGSWNSAIGDFINMAETEDIPAEAASSQDPACSSLVGQFRNNPSVGSAGGGVSGIPAGEGSVEITPDVPPVVQACMAKGYAMYTDGKVNLIGVRAQETVSSDLFVDTMFISWKSGESWETRSYPCTTKPGKYILEHPKWPSGQSNSPGNRSAILKPGQYSSWQVWDHHGHIALGQRAGPVTIYLDSTEDAIVHAEQHSSPAATESGWYGINIHRSHSPSQGIAPDLTYNRSGTPPYGSWSEGCQVFSNPHQFDEFMQIIINKMDEMPRMAGQTNLTNGRTHPKLSTNQSGQYPTFTYTLINYLDYDVASSTYPGMDTDDTDTVSDSTT
tara:strand:+ start:518 stop:1969 length:1452 start_codon:yes stop_codon:yes gene_type:complete